MANQTCPICFIQPVTIVPNGKGWLICMQCGHNWKA